MRSAFIFRRDLRLPDNTGLRAACRASDEVVCCFCLDPRQAGEHPYRSLNALQFMFASLREVDGELRERGGRLVVFEGRPDQVVEELVREHGVSAVHVNEDYTPFSKARDEALAHACDRLGASFHSHFDLLLSRPGDVLTREGTPYTVFTPFRREAEKRSVPKPHPAPDGRFVALEAGVSLDETEPRYIPEPNVRLAVKGGRKEGLTLLDRIGFIEDYATARDFPDRESTTRLSAHHKFGTVGIRETFHRVSGAFGRHHKMISELYWRDFYSHIAHFFPHVFGASFREDTPEPEWDKDEARLAAWSQGRTGFPIVDAGMRELTTSGYMHNRVRMIVASFLTKDLHLDWREGERFFARHLVDYDPAVNNGSWQWAASTGADSVPYFRIMNPWSQQARFDPDGTYIRRWVPELEGVSPATLHALHEERGPGLFDPTSLEYPPPMVDHAREREETLRRFKAPR